jgi:transmembrane sensor
MSSNFDDERIPDPIADDLQPAFSQERVDRLWRDIAARRQGNHQGEESVRRAPRGLRSPVMALAAAACVMIGGFALIRALQHDSEQARGPAAQAAPLTRSDGSALDAIMPAVETARVPLSDGSELWVDKGAVLAPLDVSERSVVLHLLRGRARFAVKPGGPRRWVVEAGAASVEVVGTRFTVDRAGSDVRVNVEEGKVLVRGAGLPDGVVRLSAGEQVLVPGKPQAVAVAAEEIAAEPVLPAPRIELEAEVEPVPPAEPAQPRAAPAPSPVKTVVPAATARKMPDADVLFAIADEARIARDYQRALEALQRVVGEYSVDPRAKLAAFTIGRIRDEQFRDLAAAADSYEKALALGLSGSLAEDCYARLMRVLESQVREGRMPRSRLQETAEQYVQRYPKGRYAAEALRLLDAKVAP